MEYLGYVVTPDGVRPNPKLMSAVQDYSAPRNVKEIRRFLGLTLFYCRFIPRYAKMAHPLHQLTRKETTFTWSSDCEAAFQELKRRLINPPVLAYPDFEKDFSLETDVSICGLGAVLSQVQPDGRLHPIAYASRALSPSEKNYGITDLETLAVVWAVSHFHYYLYGRCVTIYTDHSAVKAVLGESTPSGKHARWWSRIFSQGIQKASIVYRAGKDNANADALSRNPQSTTGGEASELKSDMQVLAIEATSGDGEENISNLLSQSPEALTQGHQMSTLALEQRRDPDLMAMISYLEKGDLPDNLKEARKITAKSPLFCV